MPPERLTLAFDTAAAHCAAALLSGSTVLAEAHEEMARGQAERLMPLLEELLTGAGVHWRDLWRIGVGIGPGNFTGTRISVAAARGLALALDIPAIGVSAFEALAFGHEGPVLGSVDARAGRVHVQAFGTGAAVQDPITVLPDAIPADMLPRGGLVIGHAAHELAKRLAARPGVPACPPAVAIARIAAAHAGEAPRPAPLYMRPADAAPARHAAPPMLP